MKRTKCSRQIPDVINRQAIVSLLFYFSLYKLCRSQHAQFQKNDIT